MQCYLDGGFSVDCQLPSRLDYSHYLGSGKDYVWGQEASRVGQAWVVAGFGRCAQAGAGIHISSRKWISNWLSQPKLGLCRRLGIPYADKSRFNTGSRGQGGWKANEAA